MGKPVEVEFIGKDRSLSSTMDNAEHKSSRLSGTLKTLGKVAAIGLAGGVLAAGAAMTSMVNKAREDEVSSKRLAVALQNTTGATKTQVSAVEDWISKQGVAYGVTDDNLRPALQKLAIATGSVTEAEKLASLAMNVSAGTGKSLEAVSMALAKAHDGNVGALGRLGIATKDASGNTLTFDQVTKNLSTTFKGQASAAANTFDGKMGRLKLMFDEAQESIGYKLIPVLTAMATFIMTKAVPAVSQFWSHLKTKLTPAFNEVSNFIRNRLVPSLSDLWGWVKNKLAPAVSSALTPVLRSLRSVFDQVRTSVAQNKPQLTQLWNAFSTVVNIVVTKVMPIMGKLAGFVLRSQVGPALTATIGLISGMVSAVNRVVTAVQSLIGWLDRIHVPDALTKVAGLAGSVVGKIPGFARGTASAPGGLALVGERGPELVNLPRGARVTPNGQTRSLLGGAGGTAKAVVDLRIGGQVIERLLIEWQRDSGRPLQITTV